MSRLEKTNLEFVTPSRLVLGRVSARVDPPARDPRWLIDRRRQRMVETLVAGCYRCRSITTARAGVGLVGTDVGVSPSLEASFGSSIVFDCRESVPPRRLRCTTGTLDLSA
ncbi:hypothetical protein CYV19_08635 [Natronobacterium gregoryi SP2]|uniref:Uncharacterized protein n=1 Tax=Natronobacterium gregoryi (strain ATCC 43098 / DSM 3393 / CCM 3738 / CIP 104747 / IAM 13177 / JCM 8860 / NBRC 102187 / NCIMB 2189 / SP2) TaxID=797304 RepID=A0A2J4JFG8_NATGS|nr:hypothetical protein CYV19_08635 [Natronobacterium gregoryi SP2]